MDLAQEIEQAQTVQQNLLENRKHNAKKRGEDAALREKIRRDYQILMQNLDQLAGEERKLKASQIEHYPVFILFVLFNLTINLSYIFFIISFILFLFRKMYIYKKNEENF